MLQQFSIIDLLAAVLVFGYQIMIDKNHKPAN